MRLCFATNNKNKLAEVQQMLGDRFEIVSLSDINCHEELPETHDTLEANSEEKARYVYDHYQIACFADDTGLEVPALGGEPGVYSARYAGPQRDNEENISLLLKKLSDKDDRQAQFRTVITLINEQGQQYQFEGVVKGSITESKKGEQGFGYDPVFVPAGYTQSFAEMSLAEKNKISHRSMAVNNLIHFLKNEITS